MAHTWKALEPRFGSLAAEEIERDHCRAYVEARRTAGIKDGTIHTELGHLRMVLRWGWKGNLISSAPHIERPSKPPPREHHLTRKQARALISHATMPHIRLFIILALTTGARSAALLGLTWDRCDFKRSKINLRDPFLTRPHKGRAVVPMNDTARAALTEMKSGALSPFVIEWAGRRVASVKKGLAASARAAKLEGVSPHTLRHSAAVHMAEDGVPMEEIASFLGHSDVKVARNIYARFSPDYLHKAAKSLEYGSLGSMRPKRTTMK
ncbi:MAG: tyrosine-type recombinase/integrase [Hyphomicrobiales bacterium]|nr:tyrosine-type recombinase/integrase [Hyphomicrobiales bacterium]